MGVNLVDEFRQTRVGIIIIGEIFVPVHVVNVTVLHVLQGKYEYAYLYGIKYDNSSIHVW